MRGLAKDDYNSASDMEDAMRLYCEDKGMKVVYIRAMKDKYKADVANCKIVINECDTARTLDNNFWPDNITVRDWYPKERTESAGANE